jgi:hypothetical protein
MAVIARRLLFAALALTIPAAADQAHDVLQAINRVATALTDGDPAGAMAPFDKSYPSYAILQKNFIGLTAAYQLTNEASVTDEQDSADDATLTMQWTLNLTNKSTSATLTRSAEVHVRLHSENGKWKIVEFSPTDLFDPAAKE